MIPTDFINNGNDNIISQAKAGSIAAIIQLLNESLAHLKVRTRAVLEGRKLLLLCEAEQEEFLNSEVIVPHVRQILEAIAPPNMNRVHFFSRIVREQQLLWTQEIAGSNNAQLLWSEQIVLKRPSLWKMVWGKFQRKVAPTQPNHFDLPRRPSLDSSPSKSLAVWLWGSVGVFLLGGLITIGIKYASQGNSAKQTSASSRSETTAPASTPQTLASTPVTIDPFVQAVRLAESAVTDGQEATNRTDWLDLAYRWQQASDLMSQVPAGDDRYKTAQDRVVVYRKNSEAALEKANQL